MAATKTPQRPVRAPKVAAVAPVAPADDGDVRRRRGPKAGPVGGSRRVEAYADAFQTTTPFEAMSPTVRIPRAPNSGPNTIARQHRYIVALSRHFYRNNSVYKHGCNVLANLIVGTGPKLRFKNKDITPLFEKWAKRCDTSGAKLPFGGVVRQGELERIVGSESFTRIEEADFEDGLVVPMRLKVLTSEYLPVEETRYVDNSGRRIISGIEMDRRDRRLAYWLYNQNPTDINLGPEPNLISQVPAGVVLHNYSPSTPGALRGEVLGTSAIVSLYRMHDFLDAEGMRKKLTALFAGFIRDQDGAFDKDEFDGVIEDLEQELEWEPGSLVRLPRGTAIEFPSIPNNTAGDDGFYRMQQLVTAAGFGIPPELLFQDWSKASDRSGQFAATFLDDFVWVERGRLEQQVVEPIAVTFVDWCVSLGLWTPPPGQPRHMWAEHTCSWPSRTYKHPVQDIEAKLKAIKAGLIDRDSLIEELGYDPEEVDRRQARSMRRARAFGLFYESDSVPELVMGEGPQPVTETDATRRLDALIAPEIDRDLTALELSDLDESVLS
jgi:lambda family phage portal protein